MLIAQISDCHIGAKGAGARLMDTLNAIKGAGQAPDLMIATGDLTETGKPAQYEDFKRLAAGAPHPLLPVAGNHDERRAFRKAFGSGEITFAPDGFAQYSYRCAALRIVVLDTVTPGSDEPSFCAARGAWLAGELANDKDNVLIAMHHPPFATGVDWVDANDFKWRERLGDVLEQSSAWVMGIICGHVHRAIFRTWRNLPVMTAPATAPQVALRFGERDAVYSAEPPGWLMHRYDEDGFSSYVAAASGYSERQAFGGEHGAGDAS